MSANHKREGDGERLYIFVRHLGRKLAKIDMECGVSPARYSVLAHLAFHGHDNVGVLAAAEGVSRPAMTRLVKDMETSGLVRRSQDARDARGVIVAPTRKGRTIVERARARKVSLIDSHLEPLAPDQRAAVRQMLEALKDLGSRD